MWFSSRMCPPGCHPSSLCISMNRAVQPVTLPRNCSTWAEFSVLARNKEISTLTDVLVLKPSRGTQRGWTDILAPRRSSSSPRGTHGEESVVQWLGPRPCRWVPGCESGCVSVCPNCSPGKLFNHPLPHYPHLQSRSKHGTHFIGWL